jgi:predicted amidophosphoribosyltransferase
MRAPDFIECDNCGKSYDPAAEPFCPVCGEVNEPPTEEDCWDGDASWNE